MTEQSKTPPGKVTSLEKKRVATFDLAAELCKEHPGQLDKAHKALREKTDRDSSYVPIPLTELKTWYEHGLQALKRIQGVPSSVQIRPPIRDMVLEAAASTERAVDEAARSMVAKVRKGAAENGIAGAHILIFQQAYLSQLTRAIVAPSHKGPGLHQVAISLCERLASQLHLKREDMSNDELYNWLIKITRLQSSILEMQSSITKVEVDLTGQTRQDLLSVRASGGEMPKAEDSLADSSNDVLLRQVEGLRRTADDIRQALAPFADMEAGIIAQVAAPSG
jgi:hypothetical protein